MFKSTLTDWAGVGQQHTPVSSSSPPPFHSGSTEASMDCVPQREALGRGFNMGVISSGWSSCFILFFVWFYMDCITPYCTPSSALPVRSSKMCLPGRIRLKSKLDCYMNFCYHKYLPALTVTKLQESGMSHFQTEFFFFFALLYWLFWVWRFGWLLGARKSFSRVIIR